MGNLFLSPSGRIGSQDFMKGGVMLIIAGIVFSLIKNSVPSLGFFAGLASFFLLYPWICIWLKRLRAGNKGGEMMIAYIALYAFLLIALTVVALKMFGNTALWDAVMAYSKQEITMSEYMTVIEQESGSLALPSLIAGVIASFLTLVIADKATPVDMSAG
ncbi:MAG: hypothetical protein EX271_00465 [Acidimicrobiales bacterium]|nr:hypothetical protein [Hyphomonadaceae bacterium]RZV44963.1 MAG: hypothetical protein EX271_00465 [Acidimicrobiales bacterium]